MLSIVGFFLAVLWFVLPFVVFATKGKLDRACELLEGVDRRLAEIEGRLARIEIRIQVTPESADTPPSPEPPAPPPER